MAICNTFKTLSKETGTFLTFGQYVEDLTAWKVLSNYYNVVPSKFIAIDCQTKQYDNWSFPRALQELFENGCACFKNDNEFKWEPKYAKNLFWKTLFEMGVLQVEKSEDEDDKTNYIKGVKYVGDINIQSYDEVEGMGYSEIYCHIPNEAPAYKYSFNTNKSNINKTITRNYNDLIEGFRENELNGAEKLSILPEKYIYQLSSDYTFSWDDKLMNTIQLADSNFKINLVVVLYDVLDSHNHNILHKDIPMGIYITGLFKNGTIQNQITKYVSNEDIYNSGTSYGLRICTRFVASGIEDNYIIKEVTCEDNNQADLSRVLSQLSISQNKMDEILSNKYVVDQNYKNLLAIFKNSKTNTPYIKRVNDNDYWFVNGKIVGPSAAENLFEPYSNDDIKNLIESNTTQLLQIFPNIIEITDNIDDPKIIKKDEYDGEYILDFSYTKWNEKQTDVLPYQIKLSWDVRYNDESINPTRFTINDSEYTNTNHIIRGMNVEAFKRYKEWTFDFNAEYEFWNTNKKVIIRAVKPSYFGCLSLDLDNRKIVEQLEQAVTETENGTGVLQKIVKYNGNITGKLSTDSTGTGTVCVIYPEYYGNLKSIYDLYGNIYSINNSTEIVEGDLKDFNLYKIRCKFHNEPTTYNAYISKEGVYINGYTLNFEVTDPRPKLN